MEALRLVPEPADYELLLEAAAELGARHLNAICEDPDLKRLSDHFAELVRRAEPYGVRPVIEFMAYRSVRALADAVAIAGRSGGGGILIDALHTWRCAADLGQLAAVPGAIPVAVEAPHHEGRLGPGEFAARARQALDLVLSNEQP
ncbi:MAG: hypothetical protein ACRDOH_24005 [Streptosporangiaceae bacterium]